MKSITLFFTGLFLCVHVLAQTTVVIDAGHGGQDKGYVTKDGITESTLTNQFAKALGAELIKKNINVEYTSKEGEFVTLDTRALKGKDPKNTFFISIHLEADANPAVHGQSIIISNNTESKTSADLAQVLALKMKPLGAVKMIQKDLTILRGNTIPSLVFSPGYMSNISDLNLLTSSAYQQRVAIMIAQALTGN